MKCKALECDNAPTLCDECVTDLVNDCLQDDKKALRVEVARLRAALLKIQNGQWDGEWASTVARTALGESKSL